MLIMSTPNGRRKKGMNHLRSLAIHSVDLQTIHENNSTEVQERPVSLDTKAEAEKSTEQFHVFLL